MSPRGTALSAMSAFALLVVAGAVLGVALAAPASGLPAAPPAVTASGPAWSTLAPAQQQALAPLQSSWQGIDEQRKMKWLEVAERFPRMPADERARVQQRMSAWAAMAPADRARARLQFQESRGVAADERQARWKAYQALPEDERKRLALAAKKPAPAASATRSTGTSTAKLEPSGPKRNVVATAPSPSPRSVTPTVVQAKPGATTTTVATVAKPPLHHQPGLPKIVSTPGFVDPNTLLPRRGPQAAAMRAAASADPTQQP